ncbi:hypothetical protein BO94DRAFT_230484 [Aspergillus sclerotioniger CBS 115572]|uniref:Uncharacterized protein n=1 Tax=Aspergillus sclerotioniger CBS 115572 TaxID=1450535 RepID=A0A317VNX5_9EURO|nr:hypothetical protein BO94DRAFT_230484 [Aspergillus sclerotioniger CBS 115572]PWY74568.1 hypothetical protein BO94DRAFT_230484 [Aspergillus sclerotioniger CBS 115572]
MENQGRVQVRASHVAPRERSKMKPRERGNPYLEVKCLPYRIRNPSKTDNRSSLDTIIFLPQLATGTPERVSRRRDRGRGEPEHPRAARISGQMTRGDRRGPPGRPLICSCRVWRSVTGSRQCWEGGVDIIMPVFLLLGSYSSSYRYSVPHTPYRSWDTDGYRWIPIPYRQARLPGRRNKSGIERKKERKREKETGREKKGTQKKRRNKSLTSFSAPSLCCCCCCCCSVSLWTSRDPFPSFSHDSLVTHLVQRNCP